MLDLDRTRENAKLSYGPLSRVRLLTRANDLADKVDEEGEGGANFRVGLSRPTLFNMAPREDLFSRY